MFTSTTSPGRTSHHTFEHDESVREFWLHRPCCATTVKTAAANQQALPLVLMLHGWGETGAQYAGLAGGSFDREGADRWVEESERGCFLVAWPQGRHTQLGIYRTKSSWQSLK